ncbi:hypothetical protein [Streptomyces sp. CRN 30]|uniref:hypothetical protein n=1 Tax=Streptomyces sp. CRN 30 TaxID=3075613 RepID=UPI002A81DB4E|nr:hypothetical protein [Streptomyces sp. CRN 30]
MARHSSSRTPTAQRALVALATASVALGAGAATASAESTDLIAGIGHTRPTSLGKIDPEAGMEATTMALGYVTAPVAGLKPNPLAGTGVDPLDNGVGTKVADFKPLSSQTLTGPVAQADSVGGLPLVGRAAGALGA